MKVYLVLLFLGLASAFPSIDHASVRSRHALSLRTTMGMKKMMALTRAEADIKELNDMIKDVLDKIVEKINDKTNRGKEIISDLIDKVTNLLQKLREIGEDAKGKTKDFVQEIRERIKEWLRDTLDKLGLGKRNRRYALDELYSVKEVVRDIYIMVSQKVDVDTILQYIKNALEHYKEFKDQLLETVKNFGVDGLRRLLEKLLGITSSMKTRSMDIFEIMEIVNQLKEYIPNIDLATIKKYMKFFIWVNSLILKGLDPNLPFFEKFHFIGQEVIKEMPAMGEELARLAVTFFKTYLKFTGDLIHLMEKKFKEVFGKTV